MFSFLCWRRRKTRKPNLNIHPRSWCGGPRWVFSAFSLSFETTLCQLTLQILQIRFTSYIVVMAKEVCLIADAMCFGNINFINRSWIWQWPQITLQSLQANSLSACLNLYGKTFCITSGETNQSRTKQKYFLLFSFLFFVQRAGHCWVLFRRDNEY